MKPVFLCYPKCSTCKKAEKWLNSHGMDDYEIRNIKEENPSESELEEWIKISGLDIKRFFNTSGMIYKERKLKDKLPAMSFQEKLAILAEDGMLVKRPILVMDHKVFVGFREKEWEENI